MHEWVSLHRMGQTETVPERVGLLQELYSEEEANMYVHSTWTNRKGRKGYIIKWTDFQNIVTLFFPSYYLTFNLYYLLACISGFLLFKNVIIGKKIKICICICLHFYGRTHKKQVSLIWRGYENWENKEFR